MSVQARQVNGRSEYLQAVEQLLGLARREIALYSNCLDAALYASPTATEGWRQWATGSSRAQARILVHDAKKAMGLANPLIHLGLHLGSRFSFRDTPVRHQPVGDILIVDRRYLLKCAQPDSRSALLHMDNAAMAREQLREFDKLWDASLPSTEIKQQLL